MSNLQRGIVVVCGIGLIMTGLFPWADYWVMGPAGRYVDASGPSALWKVEEHEKPNWAFTAMQAGVILVAGAIAAAVASPVQLVAEQGKAEEES